ncbi:type VII secretion protein EccCb [Lentzea flava]|uniref:FtsK domain-containing protein n=1 Tax=Lentzea flava TaxID=103732 RepID=A0ABQ2V680_9PSEU|nr:type VII secretion protein EccCb [Lentzea flava]MCP2203342.1 DNA segregation ATPase FtsK/SpoIIIE, S-DNA-T family [Lentzea flava]GGU68617.1 hypothetical protein GCM10010178_70590 [Lentzea flava]
MSQRLALLIATSRYLDPKLDPLLSVAEEAQQLAQLLRDPLVGDFASATVLIDSTKNVIEHRLEELLRDRDVDDEVLLYLSGHGIKNDHDQLFFAAHDTDRKAPYSTGVPAFIVQRLLEECEARAKMVLLDCCFSGMFTKRPTEMSASKVDVDHQLGRGTYVITATNELEYAYEDDRQKYGEKQRYSAFTDAVLKGLSTGAAAQPGASAITAEDLYLYVRAEVARGGLNQTPTRSNKSEGSFKIANVRSRRLVTDGLEASPIVADLLPAQPEPGRLQIPIGRAYHDRSASDDVLRLDLAGQDGHLAIVGRIYSGKSTLVHTLMAGLAAGRTPDEVSFHCLDSAGRFGALRATPHLKTVLAPSQADGVKALFLTLDKLLADRDRLFRSIGLNLNSYRRMRGLNVLPAGDHGDVFLVIDGWEQFHEQVPELDRLVHGVASRGLGFGVHVIVTARHWQDIPQQLARLLPGRVELVLDDPAESRISAELAATLPERPGWGLYGGRRFLCAVPKADDEDDADIDALIARLKDPSFAQGLIAPGSAEPPPPKDFLQVLGLPADPARLDLSEAWRTRPIPERYRVPFGLGAFGEQVELDLKEAAFEGMGPHGLVVGATGSGKSELMRTLVLGLMATHSPAELNLILIDFKGGATFRGFEPAPHVSATVTNLSDDLAMVDRLREALVGEVSRRQEVLGAGHHKNRWEYENSGERTPLPLLFVCVDEFAELLSAKPDFIDVFMAIARLGRSLGIHLLLATQRLDEGRLRGLDGFLSYRIALKTFSAAESRAALGVPDAYELPAVPGTGYLYAQGSQLVRFNAFYVSGARADSQDSLFEAVVARMAGSGPKAREVWTPPLDESPTLDQMIFPGPQRLVVPVGVVDKPFEQRRDLLWADFSAGSGHGAVVGGPQSGKSTLLRTIIAAIALSHTPAEVQFYCIDLGGGRLASMRAMPHVGAVAGRLDTDVVRRMVAQVQTVVADRERRWRDLGIDSVADFRERRRRGEIADDFGDVFLVIDGWGSFRQDFEQVEPQVQALAANGPSYGVHVIIATNRWAEIRPAMKDLLSTRFELRLGDPSESEIDRRTQVNVPLNRPGRGLSQDKLHFLTALPRIDGVSDPATTSEALQGLIARVSEGRDGLRAPAVRLLPDKVGVDELRAAHGHKVAVGVNESDLDTVYLDFDAEPHFMAFADAESGKTNLLRTIVRGIMRCYTAQEALIFLADCRRTMLGFIDTDHLLGYGVSAQQMTVMIQDVAASLRKRLPAPDVTAEQLRNRSWWSGPDVFVVVDDYDLVAPQGSANPLQPIVEFLPQAKDVGLHVITARRTGGMSRAMYDPVLGKLKELAAPLFLGSGPREEGSIVGNLRPSPQPPGRGTLVTRKDGQQRVQFAWTDPE